MNKKLKEFIITLFIGLLIVPIFYIGLVKYDKGKRGAEIAPSIPLVIEDSKVIPFKTHKEVDFKIPVITVNINGVYADLIVDTGSNSSILDYKWYKENKNLFNFKKESYIDYIGISGVHTVKTVHIDGLVNGINTDFTTSDLTAIRKTLKKHGLNVVGILGSIYLEENNYLIDYKSKTVYSKID